MPGAFDTQVLEASVSFTEQPFLKPLEISSGKITTITEARVDVRVLASGRESVGRGSIYLSDLWAWPDPSLTHEVRDRRLRQVTESIAAELPGLCGDEAAHPLELGLRLHESAERRYMGDVPSGLALSMCASPFDAAIHDAVGIAAGCSAFDFYADPQPIPAADSLFPNKGAVSAIADVLRQPVRQLPAWLIVSRGDDLDESVRPWVEQRGYGCFKVKILGRDNEDDAGRTAEVFQAVRSYGVSHPRITVDSNEAHPDAEAVLDYLRRLQSIDSAALDALEYLEQPTARDIAANPHDWREVSSLKPVLLDEGLTSFSMMPVALEQGWSGFALKTCKGHSFALVAAAWACSHGMLLSLQDLTNPGLSLIHAMLFGAYLPALNGVELNSPQYTPAANAQWLPRLACLFEPRDGVHRLPPGPVHGLGSAL